MLRRVLRRAVRYGIKLGINGAFMYKLVDVVADNMKDFYPYLLEKTEFVVKLVKNEEEAFHSTLANGEKLLNEELAKAEAAKTLERRGRLQAVRYLWPSGTDERNRRRAGYTIDEEGFERRWRKQRERARAAREDAQSMASQSADLMDFTAPFEFTGYETMSDTGTITGLFKNGVRVAMLEDEGEVILDRSCFYAESGGQVADGGTMRCDEADCEVPDAGRRRRTSSFMHHVKVVDGVLKEGMKLQLQVDVQRRIRTMANHSCVHLMQSALKKIVGDHIAQASSYVCQDYARFDFTHFEKVSDQQLKEVEALVNEFIMAKFWSINFEVMAIGIAMYSGRDRCLMKNTAMRSASYRWARFPT